MKKVPVQRMSEQAYIHLRLKVSVEQARTSVREAVTDAAVASTTRTEYEDIERTLRTTANMLAEVWDALPITTVETKPRIKGKIGTP